MDTLKKYKPTRDLLDRNQDIEFFTSLLDQISGSYVISIEAPWGSGKSYFIDLWLEHLQKESNNYTCIKIDAWQSDFTDNPFLSIVGEISSVISSKKSSNGAMYGKLEKLKKAAKPIAKHVLKATIKASTGLALDLDDSKAESAIGEGIAGIGEDYLESYTSTQKSIFTFKKSLESFANEIKTSSGKPLVIFVDELDRCRPDYTVKLLEVIKHFFDIDHIIFVLAVDSHALQNSIAAVYSREIDADAYLRKFVDLNLNLPVRNIQSYIKNLATYTYQFDYDPVGVYSKIAIANNASLRTIEQTLNFYNLVIKTNFPEAAGYQAIVAFVLAIKTFYKPLYSDLKSTPWGMYKKLHEIPELKEAIKNENYLIAALLGGSVVSEGYLTFRSAFEMVTIPDSQTVGIHDYSNLPFNDISSFEEVVKSIPMDYSRVREMFEHPDSLGYGFFMNTALKLCIDAIEFTKNYQN